jgi:secondary thiamine-phosphate synthase enzyme
MGNSAIKHISVRTSQQTQLVDITTEIQQAVRGSKVEDGTCHIFVPHTTAGITINENADPAVPEDILMELNKIVPFEDGYRHREGNSAAHFNASLVGFSEMVMVQEGRLALGTWQGIYFCEFDGARSRKVWVKITSDR